MHHHGEALRRLTRDDALVAALRDDPDRAPLSDRSAALVRYALRLTRAPASIGPEHIEELRAAGLTDEGIHDVATVVGYFNYVNRLAHGLGVELED